MVESTHKLTANDIKAERINGQEKGGTKEKEEVTKRAPNGALLVYVEKKWK